MSFIGALINESTYVIGPWAPIFMPAFLSTVMGGVVGAYIDPKTAPFFAGLFCMFGIIVGLAIRTIF